MRHLLLSITFLLYANSFACSCAPVKVSERINYLESNIESSEEIFIGDVYEIDSINSTYKIIVKEVFKGSFRKGQILNGNYLGLCQLHIDTEGTWLLFGYFKAQEFKSKDCGYSRSFEHPWFNDIVSIIPEPDNLTEEELTEFRKKSYCHLQNTANINLSEDLKYLKKIKTMPNKK